MRRVPVNDLENKTILLTGSSGGIGTATARILADRGANVVAHHLGGADRGAAEQALVGAPADRKLFVAADLAKPAETDALWRAAVAWKGRVDAVVLNAATLAWAGLEDDDETWDRAWTEQMAVNVMAPARLMRNAVRHWGAGGGVIITVSSWHAHRGATNPAQIAYAASKAAVKAAAQTVARGFATQGVLSYVIAPGIVRTRMSEEFAATQPGGEAAVTQSLTMREWVPPAEIGELVAFLATGRVRHLSGATLDVNGASYIR